MSQSSHLTEAEKELSLINHQLEMAKHQRDAQKKGLPTTCIYYDTEKLYEKKTMLELLTKHPNYGSYSNYQ